MWETIESCAEVEVNTIHSFPLMCKSSHFVIESNQVSQDDLQLVNPCRLFPSTSFMCPKIYSKRTYSMIFPGTKWAWLVCGSQILLLVFSEGRGTFAFLQSLGPSLNFLSKSLALTSASSQHPWMQPSWTQNHLSHSAIIPCVLVRPFATTVAVEVLVALDILACFNCRWVFILLRQSLHAWAMFLDSFFAACCWFYLLYYCLFALECCCKFTV